VATQPAKVAPVAGVIELMSAVSTWTWAPQATFSDEQGDERSDGGRKQQSDAGALHMAVFRRHVHGQCPLAQ
jgi:hypothetical protein